MKLSVIMPVHSERGSISEIILGLKSLIDRETLHEVILIVASTSPQETLDICRKMAEENVFVKMRIQKEKGFGLACREAFLIASGDYILMLDSDGEFDLATIPKMVEIAETGEYDLIQASRWIKGGGVDGYQPLTYVANRLFQYIFRILLLTKIHDLTFGYKMIKKSVIDSIRWEGQWHELAMETTIKPIKYGYKAVEIPSFWRKRRDGQSKNPGWTRIKRYTPLALRVAFGKREKKANTAGAGYFKKNQTAFLVIILALLVGSIYILKHILISDLLQGKPYMPFTEKADFDKFAYYSARMNRVFYGDLLVPDAHTFEYRSAPTFLPPMLTILYFPMFHIGKSFTQGLIAVDFFYGFSFFILFYIIGYLLTKQKWFSFFVAIVSTLGSRMAFYLFNLQPVNITKYLLPYSHLEVSLLNAMESAIPDYFVLLLSIIFILLTINSKNTKKTYAYSILMGVFSGLLIYTYPYYAIYVGGILTILFIYFLIIKDYAILKRFVLGGAVCFLIIIPYLVNQNQLESITGRRELLERFGGEFERKINFYVYKYYILYIILAILTYFFGKNNKNNKKESIFVISALLAIMVGLNFQLFSGYNVQSDHWISHISPIGLNITFFVWVYWLWRFLRNKKMLFKIFNAGLILFCVFSFTRTIHAQYLFSKNTYKVFTEDANLLDVMDWLNKNTEKDSVVVTPSLKRNLSIAQLTHNRIYIPNVLHTVAPEEEIIDRAFTLFKILDVKTEYVKDLFDHEKNNVIGADSDNMGISYFFYMRYASHKLDTQFVNGDYTIPQKICEGFTDLYEKKQVTLDNLLKYRADYLFWGDTEKSIAGNFNPENKDWLKKEYQNNTIAIYKIILKI